MSKPDLASRTVHDYKDCIISIMHRPETNDHVYIVTKPMQFDGLAPTRDAALRRAKADIDALTQKAAP